MRGLLLVTAGGLAREAASLAEHSGEYDHIAHVDDDPRLWGRSVAGRPVLGGLEVVVDRPSYRVLVCAGKGSTRRAIVDRLTLMGVGLGRYATVVHPAVDWFPWSVGAGSIILGGAVLTADVAVHEHVVLMPQVTLTHDDVVESFATLCAGVSVGGGVRIGEGAYLGMNACVREGVTIGAGSVLGMGSVLLGDLPEHETWAGSPARHLDGARSSR